MKRLFIKRRKVIPRTRQVVPLLPQKSPRSQIHDLWHQFVFQTTPQVLQLKWHEPEQQQQQLLGWCVIVEPRNHPLLEYVLRNVNWFVAPRKWQFCLFHGTENQDMAKQLQEKLPGLILRNLRVANLTLPEYNNLLTSRAFWEQIPVENILIFQTDSILRKRGLEEWLVCDYVGAMWQNGYFGNGGLSFRHRSAMLKIIDETGPRQEEEVEDMYFSMRMRKPEFYNQFVLPKPEMASKFSVESVMSCNDPLGIHAPWKFLLMPDLQILLQGISYQ